MRFKLISVKPNTMIELEAKLLVLLNASLVSTIYPSMNFSMWIYRNHNCGQRFYPSNQFKVLLAPESGIQIQKRYRFYAIYLSCSRGLTVKPMCCLYRLIVITTSDIYDFNTRDICTIMKTMGYIVKWWHQICDELYAWPRMQQLMSLYDCGMANKRRQSPTPRYTENISPATFSLISTQNVIINKTLYQEDNDDYTIRPGPARPRWRRVSEHQAR